MPSISREVKESKDSKRADRQRDRDRETKTHTTHSMGLDSLDLSVGSSAGLSSLCTLVTPINSMFFVLVCVRFCLGCV